MSVFQSYPCGKTLDYESPEASSIELLDIANALSHVARWTGHTRCAYSVAQHSVLVAMMLPPELQAIGVMHDATEAYMQDLPTPLKRLLPRYLDIEARLWHVIAERFGLDPALLHHEDVKRADQAVLEVEVGLFRGGFVQSGFCLEGFTRKDFHPWDASYAKHRFLCFAKHVLKPAQATTPAHPARMREADGVAR